MKLRVYRIACPILSLIALAECLAGESYDYTSMDSDSIGFASSSDGIPRWNAKSSSYAGDFLGRIWDGNWQNTPFEWIPGTNLVVYGSSAGLRVWNSETDSDAGFYNNATNSDWKVSGIALDPADASKVIWTSEDGLQIWDTISNRNIGRFNNTSDDWRGFPIANHPTNPNYIIYTSSGRLRVWDTVVNVFVGPFGLDVDAEWRPSHNLTRLPRRNALQLVFPLTIEQDGSSVVVSWPATIGATYQIQGGTRLWDFKDFGAAFTATNNRTTVILGKTKTTEFFRICE